MLCYDRSYNSKECMIYYYFLLNHGFKFQDSVWNGCHVFRMLNVNISDNGIITIENVDYCCIIHSISKSEAINSLEIFVLEKCGYV